MGIIYKKFNLENSIYKEKLSWGILYKKIDLNSNKILFRILGLKFLTCEFHLGYPHFKLFNIIPWKGSSNQTKKLLLPVLSEFLKQNLDSESYYDVLPLYNRIGETYLTLCNIKSFISKNKITNPVLISCYKNYEKLCKLFSYNIPFVKVPIIFRELYFAGIANTEYDKLKYYEMISLLYFIEFEKKLQNKEKHNFYNELLCKLELENKPQPIEFNQETIENVNYKMELLNIKQPFIFIIPEARSNETLSQEFWDKLPPRLNHLGYDLFFNSIPYKIANSAYKHCYLSLDEAKYMCTKATAIVGIRCGLMDLVLNDTSKVFCFYKKFKNRGVFPELSADIVKETFTLQQLPEANEENIYEYNAENMDEKEILDNILLNLKKD